MEELLTIDEAIVFIRAMIIERKDTAYFRRALEMAEKALIEQRNRNLPYTEEDHAERQRTHPVFWDERDWADEHRMDTKYLMEMMSNGKI